MQGTAVFELNGVHFHYPHEEPVLKDIDLKVMSGERLCILGANGSGKSTLLKMLAGLLFPQQGVFRAFGRPVDEKTMQDGRVAGDYHRKVGFIFQNSDVQLFCSTVYDEIAFGPLQLQLPRGEISARVEDMLDMLGIRHLKDKAPFKLSGGEKKKVALACTLVLNPQVLILDEPTNGLDPRTQRWLVELLGALHAAGKTILTTTHNLELVQDISDRAVVFNEDHRIVMDGKTGDVLQNTALLQEVNLVDEYYHRHGDHSHTHFHLHRF